MCVLSEGAEWEGYKVREYGEADAFGHRKKANVAEDLSEEIKKRVKEETVISDLTYELRSGEPDFIDKLVAATYGNMACDCLEEGTHGVMMAVVNGCFARMPIPDPKLGPRTVDLASMYNIERLPPELRRQDRLPDFPDAGVGRSFVASLRTPGMVEFGTRFVARASACRVGSRADAWSSWSFVSARVPRRQPERLRHVLMGVRGLA